MCVLLESESDSENPTPPAQSRGLTTAWLLEEQPLPVSRAGAPVMCRLKPGDHGDRGENMGTYGKIHSLWIFMMI